MGDWTEYLPHTVSLDEVPPDVITLLEARQPDLAFSLILVIPPQEHLFSLSGWFKRITYGVRRTPRRILCFANAQLLLVELAPHSTDLTAIPIPSIVAIELTANLLRGLLEITYLLEAGLKHIQIEFNTVAESVIRKHLVYVRACISPPRLAPRQHLPDQPCGLPASAPLKFHNYVRYALMPAEEVVVAVYQPPLMRAQSWSRGLLSPKRALAVTNCELIAVEDIRKTFELDYGTITRFIPLAVIHNVAVETDYNASWLKLFVGEIPHQRTYSFPLDTTNIDTLRAALEPVT